MMVKKWLNRELTKKTIIQSAMVLMFGLLSTGCGGISSNIELEKPVVYLYPMQDNTEVTVTLKDNIDGVIDISYPKLNNSAWFVKADRDGTLHDTSRERSYDYLYWEDSQENEYEITEGSCVKGDDALSFLEVALSQLGLNESEADDFITYWLPEMEKNKYNMVQFNPQAYFDRYAMTINPAPSNIISVFMLIEPVDKPKNIPLQDIEHLNNTSRDGYTAVEWGGAVIEKIEKSDETEEEMSNSLKDGSKVKDKITGSGVKKAKKK